MQNITISFRSFLLTLGFCGTYYGHLCKAQQAPATSNLVWPQGNNQLEFMWQGDSIHSKWEPYAALLIPVTLPDCDVQFYLQFDLGSPYSMFYRNKIKDIAKKYPRSISVTDTTTQLINYTFNAGKTPIMASQIRVKQFNGAPIDWTEKNNKIIIGTAGFDFIENKIAAIDYPDRKLIISDSIATASVTLYNCVVAGKSILLPATVTEKNILLYFDTGSSAYELLTDEKTAVSLSKTNSTPTEFNVQSWGQELTAHRYETNEKLKIASKEIPIEHVTYITGASEDKINQMMRLGIGGMTGNKLFLPFVLILDMKNKKFGIEDSY